MTSDVQRLTVELHGTSLIWVAVALVPCCFLTPTASLFCRLPAVFVSASAAGGALLRAGFMLSVAACALPAIRNRSITDERTREFRRLDAPIVAMYLLFGATDPTAVTGSCPAS